MYRKVSLSGKYWLTHLEHGADDSFVFNAGFVPYGWLEARVPEDVRTALRRNGFISGHFLGKDVDQERWIEECDWLFYRQFYCDKTEGKIFLVFEGIDTFARIYLNGTLIAKNRNMFLTCRVDVTEWIRSEAYNVLLVRILSPIKSVAEKDRTGLYPKDSTDRLLVRKAQMNYGWDFCGRCLSGGIWKDVWLETGLDIQLDQLYMRTVRLDTDTAELNLHYLITGDTDGKCCTLSVRFLDELGKEHLFTAEGAVSGEMKLFIPQAKLWWPRPYGSAHLYKVEVMLFCDGVLRDSTVFWHGIRTIQLDQSKLSQGGRAFTFIVNGRPLFVRGANWVPINAVYAEIKASDYEEYLARAEEANLSMLRVWGGGIYEHPLFYELCDKKGIMVMQDFMLACGILPQDEDYLQQVSEEVMQMVIRLRNYTCIAIWSGDNELDQAYWWYDLQSEFKTNQVNRVAVSEAVRQQDPYRPFIHSSPASPFENEPGHDDPNSPLQGDMHIYLTRFEPSSPYYYKKLLEFVPRFLSEYGFSSLPNRHTYGRYNFLNQPLDMLANPWLGELKAFQEMDSDIEKIYYSQFSHAQGLKYWIEYLRSYKGLCSGSLYWKFNDPEAPNHKGMLFPSLMSSIDFYGDPKMAFYYSKRAYEDVVIAFREGDNAKLDIFVCNETLQTYRGELSVSLWGSTGVIEEICRKPAVVPADGNISVMQIQMGDKLPQNVYYRAVFSGDLALENRFFPLDIAQYIGAPIEPCQLQAEIEVLDETSVRVSICTDVYAQDVVVDVFGIKASYSDNAFCMDAGSSRQIHITAFHDMLFGNQLIIQAWNSDRVIVRLT